MSFVISSTWGPTDPTRAMLPFLLAQSALEDGDQVLIMLFHDAVLMAMAGVGARLVPVGPPNAFEPVMSHSGAKVIACKPCFEVRGLVESALDPRIKLGGMGAFHGAAKQPGARIVAY